MAFSQLLVLSLAVAGTQAQYDWRFMSTLTPSNYWEDWCRTTTTTSSGTPNILCCELGDRVANGGTTAGFRQSPIDIPSGLVATTTTPFVFSAAYTSSIAGTLVNNGHTVQWNVPPATVSQYTVTGGAFGSCVYNLLQFHCHWGDKTRQTLTGSTPTSIGQGSEHYIQGVSYMTECHMVHQLQSGSCDPFAVLGFVFEESTQGSPWLQGINLAAAGVRFKDNSVSLSVNFASLFSSTSLTDYYNYPGSLTTPSCSEVVNWILFRQPVKATRGNITKFMVIRDSTSGGSTIRNNWRRPQELAGRTVVWYQF